LANFLNRHPHLIVELAGHTDNVGSEAYNLKLSDERAQSVRQALIEQGIDPNRMISKGYGSSKPIVPNDNDDNRAKNRRTEMIITH
jgi:outer membrane protein OmpA-like peptidoglycan-associated protein